MPPLATYGGGLAPTAGLLLPTLPPHTVWTLFTLLYRTRISFLTPNTAHFCVLDVYGNPLLPFMWLTFCGTGSWFGFRAFTHLLAFRSPLGRYYRSPVLRSFVVPHRYQFKRFRLRTTTRWTALCQLLDIYPPTISPSSLPLPSLPYGMPFSSSSAPVLQYGCHFLFYQFPVAYLLDYTLPFGLPACYLFPHRLHLRCTHIPHSLLQFPIAHLVGCILDRFNRRI